MSRVAKLLEKGEKVVAVLFFVSLLVPLSV